MEIQKREKAKKYESNKIDSMGFRLEKELKDRYIEFCQKNGISYGKRLRVLLIKDLERNKIEI